MKGFFAFFFLVAFLAVGINCDEAIEKKYENFDVEKVLKSKRLVNNYVNCLVDKGPCTAEGTDLKKVLPEALQTLCKKCTDSQKEKAKIVISRLQKDYPGEWKILLQKWDPNNEYYKKFEEQYGKA